MSLTDLLGEGSNSEGLNALDGRNFVAELKELRERAGLVDGLEKANVRLRAELDAAREQLLGASSAKVKLEAHNEGNGARLRSSGLA